MCLVVQQENIKKLQVLHFKDNISFDSMAIKRPRSNWGPLVFISLQCALLLKDIAAIISGVLQQGTFSPSSLFPHNYLKGSAPSPPDMNFVL